MPQGMSPQQWFWMNLMSQMTGQDIPPFSAPAAPSATSGSDQGPGSSGGSDAPWFGGGDQRYYDSQLLLGTRTQQDVITLPGVDLPPPGYGGQADSSIIPSASEDVPPIGSGSSNLIQAPDPGATPSSGDAFSKLLQQMVSDPSGFLASTSVGDTPGPTMTPDYSGTGVDIPPAQTGPTVTTAPDPTFTPTATATGTPADTTSTTGVPFFLDPSQATTSVFDPTQIGPQPVSQSFFPDGSGGYADLGWQPAPPPESTQAATSSTGGFDYNLPFETPPGVTDTSGGAPPSPPPGSEDLIWSLTEQAFVPTTSPSLVASPADTGGIPTGIGATPDSAVATQAFTPEEQDTSAVAPQFSNQPGEIYAGSGPSLLDELRQPTNYAAVGQFFKNAAGDIVDAAGNIVSKVGTALTNAFDPSTGSFSPDYLRSIGYEPGQGTDTLVPGAGPTVGGLDTGAYGVGGGGGSFFHDLGGRGGPLAGSFAGLGQGGGGGQLPSEWSNLFRNVWTGRRPMTEEQWRQWASFQNYQGNPFASSPGGVPHLSGAAANLPVSSQPKTYQQYINQWNALQPELRRVAAARAAAARNPDLATGHIAGGGQQSHGVGQQTKAA